MGIRLQSANALALWYPYVAIPWSLLWKPRASPSLPPLQPNCTPALQPSLFSSFLTSVPRSCLPSWLKHGRFHVPTRLVISARRSFVHSAKFFFFNPPPPRYKRPCVWDPFSRDFNLVRVTSISRDDTFIPFQLSRHRLRPIVLAPGPVRVQHFVFSLITLTNTREKEWERERRGGVARCWCYYCCCCWFELAFLCTWIKCHAIVLTLLHLLVACGKWTPPMTGKEARRYRWSAIYVTRRPSFIDEREAFMFLLFNRDTCVCMDAIGNDGGRWWCGNIRRLTPMKDPCALELLPEDKICLDNEVCFIWA